MSNEQGVIVIYKEPAKSDSSTDSDKNKPKIDTNKKKEDVIKTSGYNSKITNYFHKECVACDVDPFDCMTDEQVELMTEYRHEWEVDMYGEEISEVDCSLDKDLEHKEIEAIGVKLGKGAHGVRGKNVDNEGEVVEGAEVDECEGVVLYTDEQWELIDEYNQCWKDCMNTEYHSVEIVRD